MRVCPGIGLSEVSQVILTVQLKLGTWSGQERSISFSEMSMPACIDSKLPAVGLTAFIKASKSQRELRFTVKMVLV